MRAQLLDAQRPAGLLDLVRRLSLLQLDPIVAVAPSAEPGRVRAGGFGVVVLACRTARRPRRAEAVGAAGDAARPAEDLALYRADMADWPGRGQLRENWQVELRG